MFENSGKKIKFIVELFFWIDIIFIILGCSFLFEQGMKLSGLESNLWLTFSGIMLIILPFVLWIVMLFLYAFGDLVDKVCEIERKLDKKE